MLLNESLFVAFPDVRVVAVIEPDSLANLVTNLDVAECAAAQTTYLVCRPVCLLSCTSSLLSSGMRHLCHAAIVYRWRFPVSRCRTCRVVRLASKLAACCRAFHFFIYQRWITLRRAWACYQRRQLQRTSVRVNCLALKIISSSRYPLRAATPDPITAGDPNYDEMLYIEVIYLYLSKAFDWTKLSSGIGSFTWHRIPCPLYR